MRTYVELEEDNDGVILKKARENYAKKKNIKFGQKELAQKLGIAPSTIGLWEQGRRKIHSIHFKDINNLLGTDFTDTNESTDNTEFHPTIYFYLGLYNFTKKQYDYIIGNLLIKYCNKILDEEEQDKIQQLFYSCKYNNIFSDSDKLKMKKCYKQITTYMDAYFTSNCIEEHELYLVFTTLDSSIITNKNHLNIPVYNSSGIIEFHEELPLRFKNNNYNYIYIKIDKQRHNIPDKYEDGALALIRLGEFCFPHEDIIIQIGDSINISRINNKTDIELLKEDYEQLLIDDYKIIGALVLIDYSTCATNHPDYKMFF